MAAPTENGGEGGGGSGLLLRGADEEEEEEEMQDVGAVPRPPKSGSPGGDVADGTAPPPPPSTTADPSLSAADAAVVDPGALPLTIPTPSPFPHHQPSGTAGGGTADRLRNALHRITVDPTRDAEAWAALLTEAQSSYRTLLPNIKYESPELVEKKLDWVEGCHGALLRHFPHAAGYYVSLGEMLLQLSALPGEEGYPLPPPIEGAGAAAQNLGRDGGLVGPDRRRRCELRAERVFELALGVKMDGSPVGVGVGGAASSSSTSDAGKDGKKTDSGDGGADDDDVTSNLTPSDAINPSHASTLVGGMCSSSIDLWLLYVRKRSRDATRHAKQTIPTSVVTTEETDNKKKRSVVVREWTTTAYETALRNAAWCRDNHLLWRGYLTYVKSWGQTTEPDPAAAAAALLSGDPRQQAAAVAEQQQSQQTDHLLVQQRMETLRSIYQRLVSHPMTGLDQLWNEYEAFERGQSEQLAAALIAELLPKYQHARSVYLERNRVYNVHELRVGRLATPPVDVAPKAGQAGSGAASGPGAPDSVPGVPGAEDAQDDTDEGRRARFMEESMVLSKWRRRTGYERTNPERLPSSVHAIRVRSAYRDAICAFGRHPEVWHEWSQWELLHGSTSAGGSGGSSSGGAGGGGAGGVNLTYAARAVAVLTLAQQSLPDSCLLAWSQAELLERYGSGSGSAATTMNKENKENDMTGGGLIVMERYVSRSPNTLGFVLLQRLARRSSKHGDGDGIRAARAVFARARRVLRTKLEDLCGDDAATAAAFAAGGASKSAAEGGGVKAKGGGGGGVEDGNKDDVVAGEDGGDGDQAKAEAEAAAARMVTVRPVPAAAGASVVAPSANGAAGNPSVAAVSSAVASTSDTAFAAASAAATAIRPGIVTWHLYANHADVEHRLNRQPNVAARVYELGLRKHRTFLSTPSYVVRYADLLLELNDESNLRALLTRAVAACEEEDNEGTMTTDATTSTGGASSGRGGRAAVTAGAAAKKREAQRPLWDRMLRLESILASRGGGGGAGGDDGLGADPASVQAVESRRRKALYGPNREDVATGGGTGDVGEDEQQVGVGIQKSTLAEQLVRTDGYDVASRIVNGMGRVVESLEVMGVMGGGGGGGFVASSLGGMDLATVVSSLALPSSSSSVGGGGGDAWADDEAAGRSDASYRRRVRFQRENRARASLTLLGVGGTTTMGVAGAAVGAASAAGKLLTARERFAQSHAAQQQAQDAAVQQSPEWLKPLLLLLPPVPKSRFGGAAAGKPPPHLIEMALSSLRSLGTLPPRPAEEENGSGNKSNPGSASAKRQRDFDDSVGGGGDSSDEEDGGAFGSGYGNQFRARQRARHMTNQQQGAGVTDGAAQ